MSQGTIDETEREKGLADAYSKASTFHPGKGESCVIRQADSTVDFASFANMVAVSTPASDQDLAVSRSANEALERSMFQEPQVDTAGGLPAVDPDDDFHDELSVELHEESTDPEFPSEKVDVPEEQGGLPLERPEPATSAVPAPPGIPPRAHPTRRHLALFPRSQVLPRGGEADFLASLAKAQTEALSQTLAAHREDLERIHDARRIESKILVERLECIEARMLAAAAPPPSPVESRPPEPPAAAPAPVEVEAKPITVAPSHREHVEALLARLPPWAILPTWGLGGMAAGLIALWFLTPKPLPPPAPGSPEAIRVHLEVRTRYLAREEAELAAKVAVLEAQIKQDKAELAQANALLAKADGVLAGTSPEEAASEATRKWRVIAGTTRETAQEVQARLTEGQARLQEARRLRGLVQGSRG